MDVIVDLEDWENAWAPPVSLGQLYVSFPMDDGDEVDPKVRELAAFVSSLVTSGRGVPARSAACPSIPKMSSGVTRLSTTPK